VGNACRYDSDFVFPNVKGVAAYSWLTIFSTEIPAGNWATTFQVSGYTSDLSYGECLLASADLESGGDASFDDDTIFGGASFDTTDLADVDLTAHFLLYLDNPTTVYLACYADADGLDNDAEFQFIDFSALQLPPITVIEGEE
jgi:hypothetical protein